MTLAEALHAAENRLAAAGIEDAAIEAEVLLRHVLQWDRPHLYARLQQEISPERDERFRKLIERRLAREPTPYITGHKEFFDLDLETTPVAPIPRPETELLVEEALRWAGERAQPLIVVDVGTGCGALAVAIAYHLPDALVYCTDLSAGALALAGRNAGLLGVKRRMRFLQGDLLEPLPEPADLIVANLPYVKTSVWDALQPEIRDHEPRPALDGGPEGTEVLERFLRQAPPYPKRPGLLLAEIGWDQGERLRAVARERFPDAHIEVKKDLAGLDRVLVIELAG
ncbi:MAG: peptide chain release factor N(5)-glutamine methyltransferase [Dehalococcoidia bacterium]|nr:peptide chain release factor N(5)-glutamine methyltransferase [Dehalococcoidia bacterium]